MCQMMFVNLILVMPSLFTRLAVAEGSEWLLNLCIEIFLLHKVLI